MITNIAKIRDAKGLSQSELADRLGMHVTNLNKIERGKSSPAMARYEQIAAELGVSVAQLFAESPDLGTRSVTVKGFVQAGHWAETWEWGDDDQYQVPIEDDPALRPFMLHAAETRGPSMNKRYPERTVLVFTDIIETGAALELGKRYIVERERADGMREATVKTLWRDDAGKIWLLPESDDPRFQQPIPIEGNEDDTVRVIGRVVGSWSRE
ncbi:LexA family transcriptional regulator [Mesorhizobium sp. M4A.F.Ca.ET.020.02.1.1]|uniref:XRE family transcriptional regulator n=1 Tax=Mesorhizobium sp. M4A.F.Ca.ET.020.02.1.1 TaxID=2496652 RepID=UPI001FDED8F3|nr:LexA family transcriptional regulator [Mesorhizobium sp. M4A.F.Ca.ET.020.02.1.1]